MIRSRLFSASNVTELAHRATRRWALRLRKLCSIGSLSLLVVVCGGTVELISDDGPNRSLKAPDGFEVRLFADDDLAHDIYSLSVDSLGRVVVSSPGYVRILVDSDADGSADACRQFADGPGNGAMGMFWDGRDLICTGDAGLLRYTDADGDDRADGPPELLLAAKTGGEHDIHAVRKGPDGCWYLIGGNGAGLDERYATLPTSPVSAPAAGALLRLTPDFQHSEVVADGFRNPYDFAFDAAGEIYTYDSDGERDVSLPWYRPTRVFEILPGGHAGWISRSWKRPGYFIDMPPVIAAFGRGSPTGVECYRHTQFPDRYHGGLFALDWTYGRVMFIPAPRLAGDATVLPEEFLRGVGAFGFAPTDAAVGADGSLFVSVGGRGTRGGVYRIRWGQGTSSAPPQDALPRCLAAPQPLDSWSRRQWEPLARELGGDAFRKAALNDTLAEPQRIRAIEILTEQFGGVDETLFDRLSASASPAIRARAAWSAGRTARPGTQLPFGLLSDEESVVVRAALQALLLLLPRGSAISSKQAAQLAKSAAHVERHIRQLTARVAARLDAPTFREFAAAMPAESSADVTLGYALTLRQPGVCPEAIDCVLPLLNEQTPRQRRLEATRILQLSLGDVGPGRHAPVFDGYAGQSDLAPLRMKLAPVAAAAGREFPTGDRVLDDELARLTAMLQPAGVEFFDAILAQITTDSDPVRDVHHLIVAARLPSPRSPRHTERIAGALLAIDPKVAERGLNRDSNWDERLGEMYAALVEHDSELPEALVTSDGFGEPGHVVFTAGISQSLMERAIEAFVVRIKENRDYAWTGEVVAFLGQSTRPDVRQLLREQAAQFAVRPAVLAALARQPAPGDRPLFVEGLQSPDVGLLRLMVAALEALAPQQADKENVALVRTLRRLGTAEVDVKLKQRISRLLERNTAATFPPAHGVRSQRLDEDEMVDFWTRWAEDEASEEWATQTGMAAADLEKLRGHLGSVDWESGSAAQGEKLFAARSCTQCHGGRRALGPDLAGVAGRFSREDLFMAIVLPDRDVSPRYQTTLIVTDDGQVETGIIIYESIDGLLLRNGRGQTLRIESDRIAVRQRLTTSLMPAGLLKEWEPQDLADLYAYLQTLR